VGRVRLSDDGVLKALAGESLRGLQELELAVDR